MNNVIPSVLLIAFGFFIGNIHFCYILPKKFLDKDICELSDDHNPGASNVFTYCGVSMGILCLMLDMCKGILPIILAKRSINTSDFIFGAIMAAPVLGHAIGIFRNFHGGKCIATSFGVLIGILPMAFPLLTLASLYILFSTVLKIHPNRRRSLITFLLFGFITGTVLTHRHEYAIAFGCISIAVITMIKHLKHFIPADSNVQVDDAQCSQIAE